MEFNCTTTFDLEWPWKLIVKLNAYIRLYTLLLPRPGSVVVERSPGMREVGGSIPGRVKQSR